MRKFLQIRFKVFRCFEDAPEMVDLQLGAPNAQNFATYVRNVKKISGCVGNDRFTVDGAYRRYVIRSCAQLTQTDVKY